ncbi:No apical meristem (NAM) protein [Corchorus capsularis]|uniref:No apical meristem (NAM) protein n=1 Tax=Corchorus capsularis TaxID=210143 RepID=A0A1R3I8F4_COCAP|nr:No apical meristem (NAM) protein [Corchorus capsularis]
MFNDSDSILPLVEIGKADSSRARSLCHILPGFRFYPSEEEILQHYLSKKNGCGTAGNADVYGYDLINELNLYDYQPADLPEGACFLHGNQGRKRHWLCYTESKGGRRKRTRRAKGGFWRKIGKVRHVFDDGGNILLGTRTKFVFFEINSVRAAVRTQWTMYEYALLHHLKASFVLCRVFVKSPAGNSISENILSSSADISLSAVGHVGIQHDESVTPDILEPEINGDHFTKELEDQTASRPVSVASFEFASGISPDLPNDLVGYQLADDLMSILEEDFLELDDLR